MTGDGPLGRVCDRVNPSLLTGDEESNVNN